MKKFEIYVHIPFCVKKCNYCDFLSIAGGNDYYERYFHAVLAEIEHTSVPQGYMVDSVFIGGGTPSVLPGEWIGTILEKLREKFPFLEEVEISIECNPGTVDQKKLEQYFKAGVNRLSFGLQSCHGQELKELGRIHSYEDFLNSYQMSRDAGFLNINVDLMFGLPRQSLADWEESLAKTAALRPEHISAYSLIVEEGTPFARQPLVLPKEETERQMYERTREILQKFGYQQYEISNYARTGFACRHNVGYWKRVDYLGIGLGAASLMEEMRYTNTREMAAYLEGSRSPKQIQSEVEVLDQRARMEEFLFLGLRLLEGVSLADFKREFAVSLQEVYQKPLDKLVEQKLLVLEKGLLRLTRRGISLSNYVFVQLLC